PLHVPERLHLPRQLHAPDLDRLPAGPPLRRARTHRGAGRRQSRAHDTARAADESPRLPAHPLRHPPARVDLLAAGGRDRCIVARTASDGPSPSGPSPSGPSPSGPSPYPLPRGGGGLFNSPPPPPAKRAAGRPERRSRGAWAG